MIVFYKNKPVWMMVYYGWVEKNIAVDEVYSVLKKALMKMPEDAPFRGPKEFKEKEFAYYNNWIGNVKKYSGEETIIKNKKIIYKANYMGGLVNS